MQSRRGVRRHQRSTDGAHEGDGRLTVAGAGAQRRCRGSEREHLTHSCALGRSKGHLATALWATWSSRSASRASARQGKVLAVATRGDHDIGDHADDVVLVPETALELQPILTVLPLQLLSYFVADLRGTDVDQPRNLAKSVTVE
jgi:hypothetical protein